MRSGSFDIAVVGAGAAGMFCAGVAAQRGARVVLVDHAQRIGEKIRISGGGRCNFTNLHGERIERYHGEDARFARAALRAYPPRRFIELVRRHGIDYHEKHRGQLFCDDSSERIVAMLRAECDAGDVQWRTGCIVGRVRRIATAGASEGAPSPTHGTSRAPSGAFALETSAGELSARRVVVATGGLSIPKIGATDYGHRLARAWGLRVVAPRPALVPLTFDAQVWAPFAALAGVSLEVSISAGEGPAFHEDLLFTHRGLSGPGVLQASSFWQAGQPLRIDLAPGVDLAQRLREEKSASRQNLETVLAAWLPKRLAAGWLAASPHAALAGRRIAEVSHRDLATIAEGVRAWSPVPSGTEGYRKAEVTAGGVAASELDPRTMEAHRVPGAHFIGEVVDVTGWLGGYNFQWAWSSAYAAAMAATTR